ncbi:SMI1/KNR4 family protein [Sphingobacterium sp. ML3W]|uniref:SMI1/KNR4 family protein n=1 Tax=Sphingobacterium sp. ML3W TaxID=1538644 RepID=UPI00068B0C4C|nr:SMI1/KNR4 family protein [Sphingobacterium sp. ML3W]
MKFPQHWQNFFKDFQQQFNTEIIYDVVRVFKNKEEIEERYTTYEFEEYLPNYIPIADDSGGQVAVISKNEKDTKVYLTSYGTLIEAELKILDRNLMHFMSRKFPFGSEKYEDNQSLEEQQNFYQFENEKLSLKVSQFPALIEFFKNTSEIENLCLPENYPKLETIFNFQNGYTYNSVTNTFLYGEKEGDFKENWLVIATNNFADPFFIDFDDVQQNFPVYFAYHGAGKWSPIKVSASLENFQHILNVLYQHRFNKEELIKIVENEIRSSNEFWEEVHESVLNQSERTAEEQAQKYVETDWREAELYITQVGPNKLKIVSLLKENFKLSGAEALQMSKQERIFFRKNYLKWIEKDIQQLENLGVTVEVVNV